MKSANRYNLGFCESDVSRNNLCLRPVYGGTKMSNLLNLQNFRLGAKSSQNFDSTVGGSKLPQLYDKGVDTPEFWILVDFGAYRQDFLRFKTQKLQNFSSITPLAHAISLRGFLSRIHATTSFAGLLD